MTSDQLPAWQAQSLRLTTFPSLEGTLNPSEWWSLIDVEPEEESSRPKAGEYRGVAILEGKRVALVIQPGRIDWYVTAQENPFDVVQGDDPVKESHAIPLEESVQTLTKLASRWLPSGPAISRVAFGATLVVPVQNRQDGYVQIGRFLPSIKLDVEGSSDFAYQINRPRQYKTSEESLTINRISRWSVVRTEAVGMTLKLSEGRTTITPEKQRPRFLCRLVLDINTSQDRSNDLKSAYLSDLFVHLVDLGKEIAEKGDVP